MIKEIVEFMDLEGGKFRDIILEDRFVAKGLHVIVDKDSFEIKDFAYNDGSDKFNQFVNRYDLKKREYYCNYLNSNKNFDTSPAEGKNQIHSASPYAIFFRYKTTQKEKVTILERLLTIKHRLLITGYFKKIKSLTTNEEILQHLEHIEKEIKNKLASIYFIKKIRKANLTKLKNNDYIKIYFDYDLKYIESFYNEYSPLMSYNKKGLFEDEEKYTTSKKYFCPIIEKRGELGASEFLNTFTDKKPFLMHFNRIKTYGGFSSLYSGKVIQSLSLFEELLKLKLLPNPLPIFISNKDAIDNEGNKIYLDLLEDTTEPIRYKDIVKKVYEKMSDNSGDINDLNFYLIFWNLQNGLTIYDVDYVDAFQYRLKDFEIKEIFELKDFHSGKVENIFDLEWRFFAKFFYTLNDKNENTYMLQNNYFTEKINVPSKEKIPAMVATKFYQYNEAIFDYIYKSKKEAINGNMFDDICISIIREQIKLNDDWDKTYKIKEKLALYLSLHKNFHKGEDLATQVVKLKEKISELIENEEKHIVSDEEFAFASGQLIWYILSKNESSSKTHSLLDIFISKNRVDDFKIVISQQIQKYSHAFKFFDNNEDWFGKLVSEVMGYKLEHQTIKSLIPIIMAGYFSKNVISEKIAKKMEENKKIQNNGGTDGK